MIQLSTKRSLLLTYGSVGTNRLIRDSGAKLIASAEDVLSELQLQNGYELGANGYHTRLSIMRQ